MSFPEQMINQTEAGTMGESQQTETVEINLDEKVEVKDSTVDSNIIPPPPKAGKYPVKWSLAEKGVQGARSDKVGQFLNVYLSGKVQADGDYTDYPITEYMNSIYDKLKGTSPLHSFLFKLGVQVPNSLSTRELIELTKETLAQSPVGNIELEWRAQERDEANITKRAKNGYVTIKNRMSQFLKLPDGSYQPWTGSLIDGSKVPARAYVLAHVK